MNSFIKKYFNFLFSIIIVFLLLSNYVSAQTVSEDIFSSLQPGQWYEVPNSKMAEVVPVTGIDNIRNNSGPEGIMSLWSGGTYDTKRDRLIVWGGGHMGYGGNEVYVFDINTLQWTRLNDPSPTI